MQGYALNRKTFTGDIDRLEEMGKIYCETIMIENVGFRKLIKIASSVNRGELK